MRFPSLTPDVDLDYLFKAGIVTFHAKSPGDAQSSFAETYKIPKDFNRFGAVRVANAESRFINFRMFLQWFGNASEIVVPVGRRMSIWTTFLKQKR